MPSMLADGMSKMGSVKDDVTLPLNTQTQSMYLQAMDRSSFKAMGSSLANTYFLGNILDIFGENCLIAVAKVHTSTVVLTRKLDLQYHIPVFQK